MAAGWVAEAHCTVNGIVAVEASNALAAFRCVEGFVDEAEANLDGSGITIGWTQHVSNTDATVRRGHFVIVHLPGESFGLCHVLFVSTIDVGGRN
jgi:hypothetical protein